MSAEKCGSLCVIFITSVLLFSASVALLYIASRSLILTSEYATVSVKTHIRPTALLLLAAGILLLIVAILAFISCFKQSRPLLVLFYLTLLIVLFCEVGAVFLAVFYWSSLENDIREVMKVMLAAFTTDQTANLEMTKIQSTFHCCGVVNYEDWNSTAYFKENHDYPPSCCQSENVTHSLHTGHTYSNATDVCNPYKNGCLSALSEQFHQKLTLTSAVGLIFVLLQVLSLHGSCILICHSQPSRPPVGVYEPI